MLNTSLASAANAGFSLNKLNKMVGCGLTSRVIISNRICGLPRWEPF